MIIMRRLAIAALLLLASASADARLDHFGGGGVSGEEATPPPPDRTYLVNYGTTAAVNPMVRMPQPLGAVRIAPSSSPC
jgi:hypothetical protein